MPTDILIITVPTPTNTETKTISTDRRAGFAPSDEPSNGADGSAARTQCIPPPDDREPVLNLFAWFSPAFPVGSFAFSHGLEWAVHNGDVHDATTAAAWIRALLRYGSLRNDAILASFGWRACLERDDEGLLSVTALARAAAGSAERYLETTAQGTAFLSTIRAAWPAPAIEWAVSIVGEDDIPYPVAVSLAAAAHGCPGPITLEAFVLAAVQNLVSALIRLSVIGQTDGQRVIAELIWEARTLAERAASASLDDIGSATFRSDIATMKHEIQATRLFRS